MSKPPSAWREFELTIAHLETILRPKGFVFKSPDKLLDHDTGQLREVDCSITNEMSGQIASIECRRRGKAQDVLWIEQLACKKESLGLSETIAVCSQGFSKAAYLKARKRGVTLKTYRQVRNSAHAIFPQVFRLRRAGTLRHILTTFEEEENLDLVEVQRVLSTHLDRSGNDAILLQDVSTGRRHTVGEVIARAMDAASGTTPGKTVRGYAIDFPPRSTLIGAAGIEAYVQRIEIELMVDTVRQELTATVSEYSGGDQHLLKVADTDIVGPQGAPGRVRIVFSPPIEDR